MTAQPTYQVGDVSRMTRISVRTLHYYDEIGLLVATVRTDAGYRLYTDEDLLRLQQILIGRELGLSLEDIRRSLDDPSFDRRQALLAQKRELQERAAQAAAMIAAVDAALALVNSRKQGRSMESMFEGFDPAKYETEARERWGGTNAYQEATRRTKQYSQEDWRKLRSEHDALYADAAVLMTAGMAPTDDAAMRLAERHRMLIGRWFYACSVELHRGLADLYEADDRFTAAIDNYAKGLTAFLAAAIRANADRPR